MLTRPHKSGRSDREVQPTRHGVCRDNLTDSLQTRKIRHCNKNSILIFGDYFKIGFCLLLASFPEKTLKYNFERVGKAYNATLCVLLCGLGKIGIDLINILKVILADIDKVIQSL
jgi:hypothetical protein